MEQLHPCRWFVIVASFALLTQAALLDDFEGGTKTNLLGGTWFAYADRDDGGNSTIVNGTLDSGTQNIFTVLPTSDEGITGKGWMLHYEYGTVYPHRGVDEWGYTVGSQTSLSSDPGGGRDLTGATQITFWAKASVRYVTVRFMVPTKDVSDYGFHRQTVHLDTNWTKYSIYLSDLFQPSWAVSKTFKPANATRLIWEISDDDYYYYNSTYYGNPPEGTMWLDSVAIVGYYATPTEIIKDYPPTTTNMLPTFKWHPVDGAASYTIQIVSTPASTTNPNFTSPALQCVIPDTTFTPSAQLPSGYVYFRVKSDISRWSETGSFLIVDARIPSPISIESPTFIRKPVFSWNSPESEVTSYTLQIASNSNFTSPIISTPLIDTFYIPPTDLPIGIIYWRVKADSSAYSSASSFLIEDGRISTLETIESPTFNRKPTLSWKKPAVAVASFTLQVATNSSFTTSTIVLDAPVVDTFYTCLVNLPIATIYWRVKGDNSNWSTTGTFQLLDNRVPELIPYDSMTTNRLPTLSWKKPPAAVANYTLQVASGSVFSSSTMLVEVQVSDTFYACTTSLPIGTIFWRVKAEDSQYSSAGSFTIQDARIPVLVIYTPKLTLAAKPTLQWHTVNDATSYNIEIANNSSFTTPLISVPLVDTFYSAPVPLSLGKYYWRVKSDLVTTWSRIDNFTIVSDSIPFISRFDGMTIDGRKPVFVWNKVSGASSYRFMLANNTAFTDAISMPLTDTIYATTINLSPGKWYWKVSADRNLNLFCPVDSFVIASTNRTVVVTHHPMKQAVVTIYDIAGRSLATSVVALPPGTGRVPWNFTSRNGKHFPSGTYILRIVTPDGVTVQRVAKQR